MIRFLILALALLQVSDPVADAIGDGSLAPPTAPVYATTANFDLQEVVLTDDPRLTLRITMGALDNPGSLPLGFSNAVIEVYLDTAPGGAETLLPGSGMRMPSGSGWEYALRLTGDEAYIVVAQEEGTPADWPVTALDVATDGTTLVVRSSLPRPRHAELYALTGVYDAFGQQPWRAVAAAPSPWAFSSPTQTSPVIDLLAARQADQARALQTGTLPRTTKPGYGVGWLLLMLAGIVAAIVGLYFRRKAGLRQARPEAVAAPTPAVDPMLKAPVAGSTANSRPASMWGEGTALPLPRAPRQAAATDSAASKGSSDTSDGDAQQHKGSEQTEPAVGNQWSAGVASSEPAGPWQDVLVPTYSVRQAPQTGEARLGEPDGSPTDAKDAPADAPHDAGVGSDPEPEVVADVSSGADTGEATDHEDPGVRHRSAAARTDGPPPGPMEDDTSLTEAGPDDTGGRADADLEPTGDREPEDAPQADSRSKPFVPIVPLPAGPPARRPVKASPLPPANDEAEHVAKSESTSGEDAGTVDGWKPVLVDPHDTFLDDSHDPEEAELWPTVRAVRGRTNRAPSSGSGSSEGPDHERPAPEDSGKEHPMQENPAHEDLAQEAVEPERTEYRRPTRGTDDDDSAGS